MKLKLLNAATATNSPPSGATAGFPMRQGMDGQLVGSGFRDDTDEFMFIVRSTAGSGTMTVTLRLWGYQGDAGVWVPLGTGTDALKGTLNEQAALGETEANTIGHAELVMGLRHFDRVYLEVSAIGGTATAISAWLIARS